MSLWSVKNGVKRRISGYVPATYPAENVTYGSTDVEAELDNLNDDISAINNVYGSKNLAPNLASNWSNYGVTVSTDKNGVVTVNGTPTTNIGDGKDCAPPPGAYVLNGGISSNQYTYANAYLNGTFIRNLAASAGQDVNVNIDYNGYDAVRVGYWVVSGTVCDNIKFYPMLRDARISDPTYVPYAPTNRELATVQPEINAMNNILGAKNLYKLDPYAGNPQTINGLTFTANSDGSLTVSGTASADCYFRSGHSGYKAASSLAYGRGCKLVCERNGENYYGYIVGADNSSGTNGTNYIVDSTTKEVVIPARNNYTCVLIYIKSGTNLTTPVTFHPMIVPVSITDPTYEPYAMTNRELTEALEIEDIANESSTVTLTAGNVTYVPASSFTLSNGLYYIQLGIIFAANSGAANVAMWLSNDSELRTCVNGTNASIPAGYPVGYSIFIGGLIDVRGSNSSKQIQANVWSSLGTDVTFWKRIIKIRN